MSTFQGKICPVYIRKIWKSTFCSKSLKRWQNRCSGSTTKRARIKLIFCVLHCQIIDFDISWYRDPYLAVQWPVMCSSSSTISNRENDAILRQECHRAKMTLATWRGDLRHHWNGIFRLGPVHQVLKCQRGYRAISRNHIRCVGIQNSQQPPLSLWMDRVAHPERYETKTGFLERSTAGEII